MFFELGVLKNFANFTGKHLCRSLLLIKTLVNIIKTINISKTLLNII